MMKRRMPDQPFLNYITVSSIDATLKKITASGGSIIMPTTALGEDKKMGAIAVFKDTEGNLIGLHAMK